MHILKLPIKQNLPDIRVMHVYQDSSTKTNWMKCFNNFDPRHVIRDCRYIWGFILGKKFKINSVDHSVEARITYSTIDHGICGKGCMSTWKRQTHLFQHSRIWSDTETRKIFDVSTEIDWIWAVGTVQHLRLAYLKLRESLVDNDLSRQLCSLLTWMKCGRNRPIVYFAMSVVL